MRAGDREHRQSRRMILALDERQPGDDLRRVVRFERGPPGAVGRARRHRNEAEVAA
jgi:hypothetical protein